MTLIKSFVIEYSKAYLLTNLIWGYVLLLNLVTGTKHSVKELIWFAVNNLYWAFVGLIVYKIYRYMTDLANRLEE